MVFGVVRRVHGFLRGGVVGAYMMRVNVVGTYMWYKVLSKCYPKNQ